MKNFCAILTVLFLLFSCVITGCSEVEKYYFYAENATINMTVGEELSVKDIKIKTNILSYEHMYISVENVDILQVNNEIITPLTTGETKLYLKVVKDDVLFTTEIKVVVKNAFSEDNTDDKYINPEDRENNVTEDSSGIKADYDVCKIEDNYVYTITVFKNGEAYSNYDVKFVNYNKASCLNLCRYFNKYEITYKDCGCILIKLLDKSSLNTYEILLTPQGNNK